jgi:DNA polymerase family A/Toprim domain/CHC2 zinc finger
MPILFRDYETRSAATLEIVGAWRYALDSATEVLCAGFAVDCGSVRVWKPGDPIPAEFIEATRDPDWIVVAHNDQFETAIETRVLAPRLGWPLVPLERHRCTMAMARANAFPGSLEGAAAAAGMPLRKDPAGYQAMKRLCRPRKPHRGEDPGVVHWGGREGDLELLYPYCARDVALERELYKRLPPLSDTEQAIWVLDQIINARGFCADIPLARAARDIARQELLAIKEAIASITGGRVTSPNQRDRILAFLRERGHRIQSLQKRAVSALLAGNPSPEVRQLLELRRDGSKAAARKFDALLASVDVDGRLRTNLIYHGASTGRWSGGGNKFQPQNLIKRIETADIDAAVEAILARDIARVRELGAPITVAGDVSRSVIVAAPGHVLMGADFSSIESRVLAGLAGESWKTDAYRAGLGMYCVLASRSLKREVTPEDEAGRNFGKTNDLAFGYGGGVGAWRKFDPSDTYTDEQVDEFKNAFRREHPATVRFWRALEKGAIRAIATGQRINLNNRISFETEGSILYLTVPSGRRLAYPEARLGPGKFEDTRQVYFKDNARGGWTDARAWSGSFTENIVQAVSRDLLAVAMQRLEARGYRVVLHVHDEVVCEIPEGFGSEEEFLRLMTQLPEWATNLPVAAKAWTRKRYAKAKTPSSVLPAGRANTISPAPIDDMAEPDPIVIDAIEPDESDEPVRASMQDLVTEPIENGKIKCPFHDDGRPSLHLYDDHYYCFACGAHGDQIDWLMLVEGMSRDEALEALANWDGPISAPAPRTDDAEKLANALRLWDEAGPIAGTLAARYLTNRRIDVVALPASIDEVLRFHPRCPFGGAYHPTVIALFRDIKTDAPAGIHRTALTADGRKIDRMTLGRWSGSRAIKLWPANGMLFVGEGIETVLAAATRKQYAGAPMQPAWAMGSSGALGKLPILPGVERLRVLVDNDPAGCANAERCAKHWNMAGRSVALLKPPPGKDFNDIVPPLEGSP